MENQPVARRRDQTSPDDSSRSPGLDRSLARPAPTGLDDPARTRPFVDHRTEYVGPAQVSELEPDQARYAYVYAVGLHSAGRVSDALIVLKESLAQHPDDRDNLLAIINFSQAAGDTGMALEYAERLARIGATDPNLARLIEDLRRQANRPNAQ